MLDNLSPALAASWIAVATVDEVRDGPIQVWALGERWALARLGPDDRLVGFADRCPHRLAPVSTGRVVGGELQCGYHGWRFDADGRTTAVPAMPRGGAIPPRACLRPVAGVVEHLGLVWIAIEDPLAPLPALAGWGDPGTATARCEPVRTTASAAQLVDGFMDAAHLPLVHGRSLGAVDAPEVSSGEIVREDWLGRSTATGPHRNHHDRLVATGEHPLVQERTVTTTGYAGCNVSLELRSPSTGERVGIVCACQPESARSTRVFMVLARTDADADAHTDADADTDGMDRCIAAAEASLREDLAILERFTSASLPTDLTVEVHTKADRLSVAWRRLMADMQHHPRHGIPRDAGAS